MGLICLPHPYWSAQRSSPKASCLRPHSCESSSHRDRSVPKREKTARTICALMALPGLFTGSCFQYGVNPFLSPQPAFGGILSVDFACIALLHKGTSSSCLYNQHTDPISSWKPQMTNCKINRPLSLLWGPPSLSVAS